MRWLIPSRIKENESTSFPARLLGTLMEPLSFEPLLGEMVPVDLKETDDGYMMKVELPGLEKEDVKISLEQNVLTLSGEKKDEDTKKNMSFHQKEIRYGWFERSFNLPGDIDGDKIKAKMKKGVLTIEVPKKASAKPKRIPITAH